MDFLTTFFGQLKKPCLALGFWVLPSVWQEVVKSSCIITSCVLPYQVATGYWIYTTTQLVNYHLTL